jgi:hypothetical protein
MPMVTTKDGAQIFYRNWGSGPDLLAFIKS